jgi:hypothetical protein
MDVQVKEENSPLRGAPDAPGPATRRRLDVDPSRPWKYGLLFIAVGLATGLATWGVLTQVPNQYSSVVYLRIPEGVARNADSLMHSAPLLDSILATYEIPGATIEERRRNLDAKRVMTAARGELITGPYLFRQEVTDRVPAQAKALNAAFVSAWLQASKPHEGRKAFLQADIRRIEEQVRLIEQFLDQYRKPSFQLPFREPPRVVFPSRSGPRFPTPPQPAPIDMRPLAVAHLMAQRNERIFEILQRNQELLGVRPEVVLAEPTLPEEASWPKPGRLIPLAIATVEFVLLIGLVLGASLSRSRRP